MTLKSEIADRTRGTNAIEFTRDMVQDLSFSSKVKGSRIVLVCQSPYGFWRWKEAGHLTKERCEPGDWIVIDGTDVSFKTQEQFNTAAYGELITPSIDTVVIY